MFCHAAPIDLKQRNLEPPHLGLWGDWSESKFCQSSGTAVYAFNIFVCISLFYNWRNFQSKC